MKARKVWERRQPKWETSVCGRGNHGRERGYGRVDHARKFVGGVGLPVRGKKYVGER